jgi:hypothetical protein
MINVFQYFITINYFNNNYPKEMIAVMILNKKEEKKNMELDIK